VNRNLLAVAGIVILVIIAGAIYLLYGPGKTGTQLNQTATSTQDLTSDQQAGGTTSAQFEQENFQNIKSPHFVSSTPLNNDQLSSTPTKVEINFNFDLAEGSEISVTLNGNEQTAGPTTIASDNLSMSAPIKAALGANYKVQYTACWPDGSCHDGSFGFSVSP